MKIQQFLEHHGIARNPFADEDAQSDQVFKQHCITDAYHPAWDKIFGEPTDPATSIVFGEKGAGKTAMRLQIARHLQQYNESHPESQRFVIEYDDFNPFIDRFVSRLPARRRRIDRALGAWRLWDHMDAILALGVTDLVSRTLRSSQANGKPAFDAAHIAKLDRHQRRDLLLLAACYDQATDSPHYVRFKRLKRRLRFFSVKTAAPALFGLAVTIAAAYLTTMIFVTTDENSGFANLRERLPLWVYPLVILAGWTPWLIKAFMRGVSAFSTSRCLRVVERPVVSLWRVLMKFNSGDLSGQPLPNKNRTDDRYELLTKFQSVLETLGFGGIYVLVDRVDEPHLINGSADMMRALIWPMLDNKFLKHPGVGMKLLLPAELKYFVEREGRDFSQRARLDKQNMVPSLAWTGEALFDVANARLRACAEPGQTPSVRDLFEDSISTDRLLDSFRQLRVPRHLFKFLYQAMVAHCNAYTDDQPAWQISKERFESELALYQREIAEAP